MSILVDIISKQGYSICIQLNSWYVVSHLISKTFTVNFFHSVIKI